MGPHGHPVVPAEYPCVKATVGLALREREPQLECHVTLAAGLVIRNSGLIVPVTLATP